VHSGDKVTVGHLSHKNATNFLSKISAGDKAVTSLEAEGMSTILHEQIHACGPARGWRAYKGAGKIIDEATTELASRRIMREKFKDIVIEGRRPGTGKSMARRMAAKGDVGGAYQTWIRKMQKSIKDALGVTDNDAWSLIDEASMEFNKIDEHLDSPDQVVAAFLDVIPSEMTIEQKRDLRQRLKKIK
jgi:hypothetical protein